MACENLAQLLHRATDALFSRLFGDVKMLANFAKRLLLIKAQQDCQTIGFRKRGYGMVKMWGELLPWKFRVLGLSDGHHSGGRFFAKFATAFGAQGAFGNKTGGTKKPSRE